jgi:hypothetical protein
VMLLYNTRKRTRAEWAEKEKSGRREGKER